MSRCRGPMGASAKPKDRRHLVAGKGHQHVGALSRKCLAQRTHELFGRLPERNLENGRRSRCERDLPVALEPALLADSVSGSGRDYVLTENRAGRLAAREGRDVLKPFGEQQLAPTVRRQHRALGPDIVVEPLRSYHQPESNQPG